MKRPRKTSLWSLWLLFGASITTGPATAGPVVPVEVMIELDREGYDDASAARGTLMARSLDHAGNHQVRRHEFAGPGTTVVGLPRNTSWEVALETPGYWAEPAVVLTREQPTPQRIVLRAQRTGVVTGHLKVDRGEEIPSEVEFRFAPSPRASGPANRGPAGSTSPVSGMTASRTCPVGTEGRFRCELPARSLDFRLRARRFVSHFFWSKEIAAGALVDLGDIPLQRGSSVAGTVETVDGSPLPATLEVRLMPALGFRVDDPAIEQRLRSRALTAELTGRGFFHFEAVPPGGYSVEAQAEGWATARLPVDVHEDFEAELTRALMLERPATLELTLTPPVDPFELPWQVTLLELHELQGDLREVSEVADPDGRWPIRTLPPGRYDLSVTTTRGGRQTAWLHLEITVDSGRNELHLEVPVVPLEGTVELAGEPLAATLWFGGTYGAEKVGFDTDEQGRFSGYLPRQGKWSVELVETVSRSRIHLVPVEVEKRPGKSVAEVEISIPDTRLEGEVVDAEGEPVAGAYLALANLRGDLEHQARNSRGWTEKDGTFALWGFEPGPLIVSARTRDASSEWVSVDVAQGRSPAPVRLVVQRRLQISGRVVSPHGGVPGAQIRALVNVPGSRGKAVERATASGDGHFTLGVPHGSETLSILVLAPGFAAQVLEAPVDANRGLDIGVLEAGGTLIVDLPAREGAPVQPFLEYRGASIPLHWLSGWADSGETSGSRWVLPRMEAGDYSVCVVSDCARGFLAPHGELALRLSDGPES